MAEGLAGRVLVATPQMGDPRFARTVVYLVAHTQQYAMGLVINKPLEEITLAGFLAHFQVEITAPEPSGYVMAGGPVERERGFVLHSDDYHEDEQTIAVANGIAMTASRDVLAALGAAHRRPRHALLALGYAGWDPGQLDDEIRDNAWLIGDGAPDLVFAADKAAIWTDAMARMGLGNGDWAVLGEGGHA